MAAAIQGFVGGSTVQKGRVALEVPALVENGNSVPLRVAVESPMKPEDYIKTIAVFNERNPQPGVANFRLTPRCGRAEVSTRIRLGDSQMIVSIAELSDGTFWSDQAELVVTLPACVES
jgi:sulfur-oxidizing protein SoxY